MHEQEGKLIARHGHKRMLAEKKDAVNFPQP